MRAQEKLSLREVARELELPLEKVRAYAREFGPAIPSTGEGIRQLFPRSALAIFRKIHASRPAGPG